MAYTNSSLATYKKISPHKDATRKHSKHNPNGVIDKITIHHMAGNLSIETCGSVFQNREASSNYGIGSDGRIGMYVEEKDRSWCSSNAANDHRAITIECASDTFHPYAINNKVYKSLIDLCTDICKRNGIKELKWKDDKTLIGKIDEQNMTIHKWFANKDCPGEYIHSRLGQIADEVNEKLKIKDLNAIALEVIKGLWGNGQERKYRLTKAGYSYSLVQERVNTILKGK